MIRRVGGLVLSALILVNCGESGAPQSGGNGGNGGNGGGPSPSSGGRSSGGSGGLSAPSGGAVPFAGTSSAGTSSAGLGGESSLPMGGESAGESSSAGEASFAGNTSGISNGGSGGSSGSSASDAGATAKGGNSSSAGNSSGGSTALAGSTGSGGAAGGGGGGENGGAASGGAAGAYPALVIASDTSSIEFTPALIAAEDYYPGEANVISGGIVRLLSDSNVDLGTNAETQSLRRSATNPNLRIIFTVTQTYYRIVANKQAGITQLSDLRGKRIGTIANTSAAYFVQKYLSTVGLAEGDYSVVSGNICMAAPCGANTLPGLIERESVDAVALWEPTTELAAEALGDNAIIFQDRTLYREIVNLHSTTEKLADPVKRRGIVEFVRSLVKAQTLYRTEPERVWPRISEAIGIQQSVLEAVWHDESFESTLVPDLLDVLEEEEPWVARQSNRMARPRSELATMIDPSIIMEVLGPN